MGAHHGKGMEIQRKNRKITLGNSLGRGISFFMFIHIIVSQGTNNNPYPTEWRTNKKESVGKVSFERIHRRKYYIAHGSFLSNWNRFASPIGTKESSEAPGKSQALGSERELLKGEAAIGSARGRRGDSLHSLEDREPDRL